MEDSVKAILSTIDDAISNFQSSIPGVQKMVYDELQPVLKQLQVKNGRLLNNVENLKLIGTLKMKLQKVIVNAQYKESVKEFLDSYNQVANLNIEYFKQFNDKYKPNKTLPYIRDLAIDSTVNDLLDQGLNVGVIAPIQEILKANITTGGDYSKFQEQIRNHILTNDTGEGSLERYTKQITTDAIHQYNAQYQETIAQDLQFNWGRYVGSNLTTTRQFCALLTKKQWVHKSELPEVVKGHIDDENCKLSKSTGLPLGMIAETNADNFKVRRGGYNCGHQFFWVPDVSVPDDVKNNIGKPKVTVVPTDKQQANNKTDAVIKSITANNKAAIDTLGKRGIKFPDEILRLLPEDIKIVDDLHNVEGSHYSPNTNSIIIAGGNVRAKDPYYQKKIVLHEGGHAIHMHKKIITTTHVEPEFKAYYDKLKGIIKGHEADIDSKLYDLIIQNSGVNQTKSEQLSVLYDTLGSLTRGRYGGGHELWYYMSSKNYSEMEVFAHSMSAAKLDNEFADLTPELKSMTDAMREYGLNILQSI